MTKWNEMKSDEKIEFCKRHDLSTHPEEIDISPMEYALDDIKWIKEYGNFNISINWLKAPLIELGFYELWEQLERVYNE